MGEEGADDRRLPKPAIGHAASSVKTWRSTLHLIFEDAIDLITFNPAAKRRGRGKRAGRSRDRGPARVRANVPRSNPAPTDGEPRLRARPPRSEVHEELGIKPHIGRLLVVDWAPNPGEGDKVLYLFDGGRLSADQRQHIALQADELRSYDFHHAEQLPELTIPRLARRITAGIQAHAAGLTAYLEQGVSPETGA
ncbi:hypothetical protein GCM10023335_01500 [Streptomyces siamensis]|uniref:Uncharacterized protein n=1 Tax=Streptomyces siamensis TaxID=1274986 RepID=A0ABP9ICI4_9ACTN